MATIQMCSVKDLALGAFGRPFFVPALGVAMRSFTDEVNRKAPDNVMNQHPEDFELYHLGLFDEETGAYMDSGSGPTRLARALDVVVKEQ